METITFNVETPELRKHVDFVRNGLGNSPTDLPVNLIRFEVEGNKTTLFAANKETFCRTEMKVSREGDKPPSGTFALLGVKLARLLSATETELFTFKFDGENCEIQAGFLTVNFETYDSAVLKTTERGNAEHLTQEGTTTTKVALEEALTCARSCTTQNSIKPEVTHAELRKGRLLSSDGRKIMVYTHDGFDPKLRLKVPSSALSDVLGAVKNMDAEHVALWEGKSYFYLKANGNEYTLGTRKTERTFPPIEEQVTKAENPTDEVSLDKAVLEHMMRGVSLGLPSDEVRVTVEVAGSGNEAYVEISALNSVGRRSYERASCGRKGENPITFPISFEHLLSTLTVFKGDSTVDLTIMAQKHLMMVRDHTEAREVMTIIPFRTDKAVQEERKEKEAVNTARKAADTKAVDLAAVDAALQ